MVSALDSGSGGPGSSPGRGIALLSTQVYKFTAGGSPAMD